ncbi:membrane protein [Sinosporangium siamense]|uniref:Membrane protein n=1 Tax=Sinosporangium siamense TaxID=1367973 RepID=A0A919RMU8_9ACTN|nr:membrane protein [Sinosporangium siamense]
MVVEPAQSPVRAAETLPAWRRTQIALAVVTLSAFALYAFGLPANVVNTYYAAAAISMTESWSNFLFGAFDPSGFITIDKPPGGIWPQALSVMLFGPHTWALLLPQVLAATATVPLLFAVVRRFAGDSAGLIAAAVMAGTPSVVVSTRLNLPDAFLVLTLVAAAWTATRMRRDDRWRWPLLTGLLVGYAFNIKLVQGLVVLAPLLAVHLAFGSGTLRRRLVKVTATGAMALAVSSAWLVLVAFVSGRPYIDGSTGDSGFEMAFVYNLWGRVSEVAHGVFPPVLPDGMPVPLDHGGPAGVARLFNAEVGDQVSWLLPFALIGLLAGVIAAWRRRSRADAPGTHTTDADALKAGWLLWGGWLVVYGAAVSSAQSIHPYYTSVLGPAVGALAGGGAVAMRGAWRSRAPLGWTLPAAVAATGALAAVLVGRAGSFLPGLAAVPVVGAVVYCAALLAGRYTGRGRGVRRVVMGTGAVLTLAPLALWSLSALYTPPNALAAFFMTFDPAAGPPPAREERAEPDRTQEPEGLPATVDQWMTVGADPKLVAYIKERSSGEEYDLATTATTAAAPYIWTHRMRVIPMGGFAGTAPALTADGLAELVGAGRLRFVLIGGFAYNSDTALERKAWVVANCRRIPAAQYTDNALTARSSALFDCR